MRRVPILRITIAATCAAAALHAAGADDPKQRQDLSAVIALHAKPCGEVVHYDVKGDNDYVATCKDGNRYHVYVNKQGRVVVEKQ